jgi:exosortase C (VPDSG-CTERM-specific)
METTTKTTAPVANGGPVWQQWFHGSMSRRLTRFGVFVGLLCVVFLQPLISLIRVAQKDEMSSHILLIPFICGYLVWIRRKELPLDWVAAPVGCLAGFFAGCSCVVAAWFLTKNGWHPPGNDHLMLIMVGFYFLFVSACCAFLGRTLTLALTFPLCMLIFIIPLPHFFIDGSEIVLQHASAWAAHLLFQISGTPVFQEGLVFSLPGLSLRVAQECSGVRSSLVLLITSLLASNLYLRTPWKRVLLVAFTLPLGILRNAFRIFSLAMLSIHVDPAIMDGALHHKGGPIFFAISLLPFFGLLIVLTRSDSKKA